MTSEITALLAPEEKILWSAQPRPAVFMLRGLPNIAYGVTWAVLGAFWYRGAGGIGHLSAFDGWWRLTPLFSLPFIFAGFSFFFAPIRLGARARRTWYLVTDRRVMWVETVARKGEPPKFRVFGTDDIEALQFLKQRGGFESIVLARRAAENPHLQPRLEDGFFGLSDGEAALEAIRASSRAPVIANF